MDEDKDLVIVKQHTAALREHFDSVQIFCTRHEGTQGTTRVSYGTGDWFARYGVVKLWSDAQNLIDSANHEEL